MRRKDREMSEAFGYEVIDRAVYVTVGMVSEGELILRPMSPVRLGRKIYLHSALSGEKSVHWQDGAKVVVNAVADVKIPQHIGEEEIEEALKSDSGIGALVSQIFTTEFASSLANGRIYRVRDEAEAKKALYALCEKYVPERLAYAEAAIEASLKRTAVYRIEIDELSAKRKRYDKAGVEMKWQRMDDSETEREK